jgi:hypothetical protein
MTLTNVLLRVGFRASVKSMCGKNYVGSSFYPFSLITYCFSTLSVEPNFLLKSKFRFCAKISVYNFFARPRAKITIFNRFCRTAKFWASARKLQFSKFSAKLQSFWASARKPQFSKFSAKLQSFWASARKPQFSKSSAKLKSFWASARKSQFLKSSAKLQSL